MKKMLIVAGALLLVSASQAQAQSSFTKDVKPFLDKYCTDCHGATQVKAGVKLDTYADLIKAGKKGAPVVASKPDQSLVISVMAGKGKPMPPKNSPKPTAAEIAKVRAWITAGAKDDSTKVELPSPINLLAVRYDDPAFDRRRLLGLE